MIGHKSPRALRVHQYFQCGVEQSEKLEACAAAERKKELTKSTQTVKPAGADSGERREVVHWCRGDLRCRLASFRLSVIFFLLRLPIG